MGANFKKQIMKPQFVDYAERDHTNTQIFIDAGCEQPHSGCEIFLRILVSIDRQIPLERELIATELNTTKLKGQFWEESKRSF